MSKMEFSDEFDFENRITDTSEIPEDTAESDNPLRPKTLSEYIGQEKAKENGLALYYPAPILCTDNAAMIGSMAYYNYINGVKSDLYLNAVPGLKIGSR